MLMSVCLCAYLNAEDEKKLYLRSIFVNHCFSSAREVEKDVKFEEKNNKQTNKQTMGFFYFFVQTQINFKIKRNETTSYTHTHVSVLFTKFDMFSLGRACVCERGKRPWL